MSVTADRSTDAALRAVEERVLWLAAAIVDAANRGRPNTSGVKVGGHQSSSASMVDIMVALWFHELTSEDRVSVKPHASPVLHAINYLLGDLDAAYLPRCAQGGLQSYPTRLKDPDTVDFSTGSVGIGATAAIWGALAPLRALPVRRRAARPAVRQPARRRRARRGRDLGGRRRPAGRRSWASCSGSSTSTGSRWTGSSPTSRSRGCRACSRPPAGRSSRSSGAG